MERHIIKKDKKGRNYFQKSEIKNVVWKYNLQTPYVSKNKKYYISLKYMKRFHLNSSSARILNCCLITGSTRWVLRHFRYSRMTFRRYADKGWLMGVKRSSW